MFYTFVGWIIFFISTNFISCFARPHFFVISRFDELGVENFRNRWMPRWLCRYRQDPQEKHMFIFNRCHLIHVGLEPLGCPSNHCRLLSRSCLGPIATYARPIGIVITPAFMWVTSAVGDGRGTLRRRKERRGQTAGHGGRWGGGWRGGLRGHARLAPTFRSHGPETRGATNQRPVERARNEPAIHREPAHYAFHHGFIITSVFRTSVKLALSQLFFF